MVRIAFWQTYSAHTHPMGSALNIKYSRSPGMVSRSRTKSESNTRPAPQVAALSWNSTPSHSVSSGMLNW